MAIDPDDLLIFKKRLNSNNELPSPANSGEKLLGTSKIQPTESRQSGQQHEPAKQTPPLDLQEISAPKGPAEDVSSNMEEETPEAEAKAKLGRSAKDNIAGAKGRVCVNHPWRRAYSLCNYCKRPFCYADLISYNKSLYCLEDIDYVSRNTVPVKYSRNIFTNIAALVLVINSAVVVYLTYPSIISLLNSLGTHINAINVPGVALTTLITTAVSTFSAYPFQSVYVAVALLSFLSGISVFASRHGFYFGIIVAFFTLLVFSYEYLSGIQYTYVIIISGIAFVEIAVLAYSRMSSITFAPDEDAARKYIDWPRPETF